MRNITLAFILILASVGAAFAQADAKADAIIKQARAAIGKEDKFKAMQTLSAEGLVRQSMGQMQNESTLELETMSADRIKTTLSSQFVTQIRGFDGTNFWNDFIPGVGMGGGGGGGMRMIGGGGPGGPGGPGGGAPSAMQTYMQQQQKRDLAQLLLALFLAPPASLNMTFAFVGEAPGPNDSKLNVIDAKYADGLVTRLYFTQADNRLIGLSYKAKSQRRGGPGGPGGGQQRPQAEGGQRQGGGQAGGQQGQGGQRAQMTPEEIEKMRKERQEAFDKQPESDFRWAFDDYRAVNGLNLPHRITKSENGTPNEEWEISKYKANNTKITADKFVKKEKAAPTAQP